MMWQVQKVHSMTNAYMYDWPTRGNSWYDEITWYMKEAHNDQMTERNQRRKNN